MDQARILLTAFILVCLGAEKPVIAEGSVTFACNEFPPYKMENSPSGLPGFDVEFLREAFKRGGIPLKIQYMPWKRALEEARHGRVNGVCSCSKAKEREDYLYFSAPLGKASSGLFSLKEDKLPKLRILEEIGDKSVGIVRGYNILENLIQANVENVLELSEEQQGLKVLLNGRIDYYYSYEAPTRYYLKQIEQSDKVVYNEISYKNYYSCFSKAANGSEDLLGKFNAGLSEIKADGTYKKILAKYR